MKERDYRRLSRRYRAATLILLVCLVVGGLAFWRRDSQDVTLGSAGTEYGELSQAYATLETEHVQVVGAYQRLKENQTQLERNYNRVTTSYAELDSAYQELTLKYETLASDLTTTQHDYQELMARFDLLGKTTVTPPYIAVEDRQVEMAFLKLDGSVMTWNVPFESLETDIRRGYERREGWLRNLNPILSLQDNEGRVFAPMDFRPYIDPRPFEGVMAQLYEQSPDDDTFVREVWNIIAQLSTYSADITETPRYPLETLLAGGGDCEDTAVLFASMIQAADVDWPISLVYMDSEHPEKPQTVNHMIVFVDTGAREYLVETTSSYTMEPFVEVEGWYIEVQ